MSGSLPSFYEVVTAAVNDITENGSEDIQRVATWIRLIREAAERSMVSELVLEDTLQRTFRTSYRRMIEQGGALRVHIGIPRFTIERLAPRLRGELDSRLTTARHLIKLNREESMANVERRFAGWASSVPPGGTDTADKVAVKTAIRKSLTSLPFEDRRVLIDQANKFVSNLHQIIATDGGALAAKWHSHYREINYNYRKDHKLRDDVVYVLRGNWALERGLMKLDGHLYTDDITAPGEEVFCRCTYTYIYGLRDLPPGMITELGRSELQRVRTLLYA